MQDSIISPAVQERFWSKVTPVGDAECWEWPAVRTGSRRYGLIKINGKMARAHRVSFAIAHGRSLDSLGNIHHTCRNKSCVNPAHLMELTQSEHAEWHALHDNIDRSGEHNGFSRLSSDDVTSIRGLLAVGLKHGAIADRFGVCRTTVCEIANGKNWRQ